MSTVSFGATVGYAHTFVFKKYFCLNISLIPGYGVYSNSAHYDDGTPIEKGLKSAFFFQSRVSFLYQKNNFYACFSGVTGTQTTISKSPYSFLLDMGKQSYLLVIVLMHTGYQIVKFSLKYKSVIKIKAKIILWLHPITQACETRPFGSHVNKHITFLIITK